MTKTNLTLAALLAATSAGLIYQSTDAGKTVSQVAIVEPSTDAVVLATDAATQAKIAEVGPAPQCAQCVAWLWDGSKRVPADRWCCNGAVMPRSVSDGLSEAWARLEDEAQPFVVGEGEAVIP